MNDIRIISILFPLPPFYLLCIIVNVCMIMNPVSAFPFQNVLDLVFRGRVKFHTSPMRSFVGKLPCMKVRVRFLRGARVSTRTSEVSKVI